MCNLRTKHMKNLKNCQNYDRLNIEWVFVPNRCLKCGPYGTYVLLGSLKRVLRGRNITESTLKELKVNDEYVQQCNMNSYDVLVLCRSQWDSVFTWLLLWMVDVEFLGSWKNCVLANAAAPNAGHTELASWDELTKCMWCVFLLVFTKKSKFHFLERFWSLSLKVVSHGDFSNVYWR